MNLPDKNFYTIPDLEKFFGISDTTLVRLIHKGYIRDAFRLGKKWLVPKAEVERISGALEEVAQLEQKG